MEMLVTLIATALVIVSFAVTAKRIVRELRFIYLGEDIDGGKEVIEVEEN